METALHWIYTGIAALLAVMLVVELFQERRWRFQIAIVLAVIPLILRALHIK